MYAVLAASDLTFCDPFYGPALRDRPLLASEVVRYEGEPVVAVAAVDEATAAEALDLVEVEYEELPAVTTLEEALAPGAPLVHTGEPLAGHFSDLSSLRAKPGTNICHQFDYTRGDVASAPSPSAHLVLEDTYTFPRVQHYSMEPHGALAHWDDEGGLTVWAATQNPFSVRSELAKMFALNASRIRIAVPLLGGGFGGKTYAKLEPLAAALARVARRPVRLLASVEDAFRTVRRCSARVRLTLAFHRDGSLARARLRGRLRHRRLRRHRAARDPEGDVHHDRALPRPAREAPQQRRLHQHHAGGRLPRLRRAAARLGRGVDDGRGGRPPRTRPRRPAPAEPARARRRVRARRHAG